MNQSYITGSYLIEPIRSVEKYMNERHDTLFKIHSENSLNFSLYLVFEVNPGSPIFVLA